MPIRTDSNVPFAKTLEGILKLYAKWTKQNLESFCKLEANIGRYTFVAQDASLVTVIRYSGSRSIIGPDELARIVEDGKVAWMPFLRDRGHAIQFWFGRDPGRGREELALAAQTMRNNAAAAMLDVADLIDERERYLGQFVNWEASYLVLWTRPGLLTPEERKQSIRRRSETMKELPRVSEAQYPWRALDALRVRHDAFASSVITDLEKAGLHAYKLDCHEALQHARDVIYPSLAGSGWRPALVGDEIRVRRPLRDPGNDTSHLLWPDIPRQFFAWDAEEIDKRTVLLGDTMFSGVDIDLQPQQIKPFMALLSRLWTAESRPPWRVSFLLEGDGLGLLSGKMQLASMLAWAGDDNKRIRNAVQAMRQESVASSRPIVRFRVSLCTWAPRGEMDMLETRRQTLLRAVEGWGGCVACDLPGDALEGVMSSSLALDCASTATASAMYLDDAMAMLPWARPASPWEVGQVLFRSPDGKLYPYQPGSSRQDFWVDLVYSPPGGGKSVLLNTVAMAACLAARTTRSDYSLPLIRIIDVGPSASGLISALQDGLPRERQHEAAYYRLQMRPEHTINVFDTQLGCRYPLPSERAFIVNFMTLLCTPLDRAPYDGMASLVNAVVKEVFRLKAEIDPNRYQPGVDRQVDEALARHGIRIPDTRPTWWEVVDALFEAKQYHYATIAQRYAVPTLVDCISAARQPNVRDIFVTRDGMTRVADTTESVIDTFIRCITDSQSQYPILSGHTRFDIGDTRVCVLDLDEVAPTGNEVADRQTALMYMLARHVLARDFFLNDKILNNFPERYRPYHEKRIAAIMEEPKRLQYDEFHRTENSKSVRRQVERDIREGRKWGIQICLASQRLDDFTPLMKSNSTGIWIMKGGDETEVRQTCETFGLKESARFVIRNQLRGPQPGVGAPFFVFLKTKAGEFQQYLVNTLGPIELWAFSTSAKDVQLRKRLTDRVGTRRARALLASVFPGGSAEKYIEDRLKSKDSSIEIGAEMEDSIIDEIATEMISGKLGGGLAGLRQAA